MKIYEQMPYNQGIDKVKTRRKDIILLIGPKVTSIIK